MGCTDDESDADAARNVPPAAAAVHDGLVGRLSHQHSGACQCSTDMRPLASSPLQFGAHTTLHTAHPPTAPQCMSPSGGMFFPQGSTMPYNPVFTSYPYNGPSGMGQENMATPVGYPPSPGQFGSKPNSSSPPGYRQGGRMVQDRVDTSFENVESMTDEGVILLPQPDQHTRTLLHDVTPLTVFATFVVGRCQEVLLAAPHEDHRGASTGGGRGQDPCVAFL